MPDEATVIAGDCKPPRQQADVEQIVRLEWLAELAPLTMNEMVERVIPLILFGE